MKCGRYAMIELFCLGLPMGWFLTLMCGGTWLAEGLTAAIVSGGKLLLGPIASAIWLKGTIHDSATRRDRLRTLRDGMGMPLIMLASLVCGGCVSVRWSWDVEDGAIYETNQKAYVIDGQNPFGWLTFDSERNRLMFTDKSLNPDQERIELLPKTKIREVRQVGVWGFSFWWHFGPYADITTFGEILDGPNRGRLVDFGHARECCPRHGWWYLCPLDCSSRNLKCLTPEKYDDRHIGGKVGVRHLLSGASDE